MDEIIRLNQKEAMQKIRNHIDIKTFGKLMSVRRQMKEIEEVPVEVRKARRCVNLILSNTIPGMRVICGEDNYTKQFNLNGQVWMPFYDDVDRVGKVTNISAKKFVALTGEEFVERFSRLEAVES